MEQKEQDTFSLENETSSAIMVEGGGGEEQSLVLKIAGFSSEREKGV